MEELYGMQSSLDFSSKSLISPENLILPMDYQSFISSTNFRDRIPVFGSDEFLSAAASAISEAEAEADEEEEEEDILTLNIIKAKIASHPSYLRLLRAFIDCQKVGAPPEIGILLEEIRRENESNEQNAMSTCFGADPELDEFMETYCEILEKYKSDISRPFYEASSFFSNVQIQFNNLCAGGSSTRTSSKSIFADEDTISSDEEFNWGERELRDAQMRLEDKGLKDMLISRFGRHIGTLKLEFSKKRKKGKLPKEGRKVLLEWWNLHYKWPYPTEADKIELAETTGLDPKQINNWFINQRKRHWKPSESMQFAAMDNVSEQFSQ